MGDPVTNGGQVAGTSTDGGTFVFDMSTIDVDDAVQAVWDGPTTHLDWEANSYATAEATFVGDRVVSPGDDVHRTLNLSNGGPSDGVMSIGFLLDETIAALTVNPDLAQNIVVYWDVAGITGSQTFASLLERQQAGTPVVAEVQVPQGATSPVTIGFRMDADITTDRALGQDSALLSFQVLAHMQGDTTTYVPPLPKTGVAVLGGIALAAGLLALGWLALIAARRRRRCDDCDQRITTGHEWSEYHLTNGRRHIQCDDCHLTIGPPTTTADTTIPA